VFQQCGYDLDVPLEEYRRKRDFSQTPEPSGDAVATLQSTSAWEALPHGHRYCVQMHRATRMHLDFRLEHDGVLLSWAIPRGPTLDPKVKRLLVQTEDHPIDYGDFEGVIPSGYGAGTVLLWDIGTYEWVKESAEDFDKSLRKGDLKFRLSGQKLAGEFALVRIGDRGRYGGSSDGENNWLMIKKRDDAVIEGYEALDHDVSVKTGRSLAQVAADGGGDPRELRRAARAVRAKPAADATPAPRRAPAARRPIPSVPKPMLATPVDRPFSADGWMFELKYDGVRAMVSTADGEYRVVGRSGRDETARYPELRSLVTALHGREAIVDGEIVVFDERGRTSFERLQSRINVTRESDIERGVRNCPVAFAVFDIVYLEGRNLMETALRIRKKTLRDVIVDTPGVLYADHIDRVGEDFFLQVQRSGAEGIVAKRGDSTYQPGRRSRDWLKIKAWHSQSCVIVGFTAGQGRRMEHMGALILAVMENDELVHCGQVGTGFDDKTLRMLMGELRPRTVDKCPLRKPPQTSEPATWVRPDLVCEVRHGGWTSAGILRHPAYVTVRPDLTPADCTPQRELSTSSVLDGQRQQDDGVKRSSRSRAGTTSERAARRESAAGPQRGSDRVVSKPPRPAAALHPLTDDIDDALQRLKQLRQNDRWDVAGRRVALTNLDKVLWPSDGYTKRDMVEYYVRMAPYLLPYLRDRPLSMQVFPDGITGKSFWRKDKPAYAPAWMESWTYHGEEKVKTYIVVNEVATLAWVANAGVIDLHPWHSRIDAPDLPDWAVFDLDPFEPATFSDVVVIAKLVKAALDHYHMHAALKTSGQTGLQIYVPVRRGPDYDAVRNWVEDVGRSIGRVMPDLVTWEWTVAHRTGKIRIDYTQNIINKTLAAPYSLRPAPTAPVSTPIAWEELDDPHLRPDRWNIRSIGARVAQVGDLFTGAITGDQDLPIT
jgi:bifunctional non-homologous end joining protein LigD